MRSPLAATIFSLILFCSSPVFVSASQWEDDCYNERCAECTSRPRIDGTLYDASESRSNNFNALIDLCLNGNEMDFDNCPYDCDISCWDTSEITNMNFAFYQRGSFNRPELCWNVSGVKDTGGMFASATSFDGDVSGWDVSGVINMQGMFQNAASFNGYINRWDVRSVQYMEYMLYGATSFNKCLSTWAAKTPNTVYTNSMFYYSNCTVPGTPWEIYGDSPDPQVGPWCQGNDEGCYDPTETPSTSPSANPSVAPSSLPSYTPVILNSGYEQYGRYGSYTVPSLDGVPRFQDYEDFKSSWSEDDLDELDSYSQGDNECLWGGSVGDYLGGVLHVLYYSHTYNDWAFAIRSSNEWMQSGVHNYAPDSFQDAAAAYGPGSWCSFYATEATRTNVPTAAPVDPTAAPIDPTSAPVDPTAAPINPTSAPIDPTTTTPSTPVKKLRGKKAKRGVRRN